MTGFGDHISNLAKLLVKVRTVCLSTLVHWMFLCEQGFWLTSRFALRQLSVVQSTMQKSMDRLNRCINLEWLSIYPCEDTTEKTSSRNVKPPGSAALVSTKHSSTSIPARADAGASGKGVKNVRYDRIGLDGWGVRVNWESRQQSNRTVRSRAEAERQSSRIRARIKAARSTGCSDDG